MSCQSCAPGSSLYDLEGALSCDSDRPGECLACPVGTVKGSSSLYSEPCVVCAAGKEANADQSGCVWCDSSIVKVERSGIEVGMLGSGTRLGRPFKANSGAEFCNATTCKSGQFPTKDRTACMRVEDVSWNGADAVTWENVNIAEVGTFKMAVKLVPLRFVVKATHAMCINGAGKEGIEVLTSVTSWSSCAKACHDAGVTLCNHNRASATCHVLIGGGKECVGFDRAPGWFALQITESSQQLDTTSTVFTPSTTDSTTTASQTTTVQLPSCLKDDSFVKSHVALEASDQGPPSGSPTGVSLEDEVFQRSVLRLLDGNTAPTLSSGDVQVRPAVIYPTSPWVSCYLPIGKSLASLAIDPDTGNTQSVASYSVHRGKNMTEKGFTGTIARDNRIIIDHLLAVLKEEEFGATLEPVDSILWPGDLKLLAHTTFPTSVRENLDLLRAYVEDCLLDTVAVTDNQMALLGVRVSKEISSTWAIFAESDGGEQKTFGRRASHGVFQHHEKFRCSIALTDGCEKGRQEASAPTNEVGVTPLRLENHAQNHKFEADAETLIVIVGAGFVAAKNTAQYTCKWSQPSLQAATYSLTAPGKATSFGTVACTTPKWVGSSGSVEISVSGPVVEYRGCYRVSDLVTAVNDDLPASNQYSTNNFNSAPERSIHTGLASCQLLSTTQNIMSNVFALYHDSVAGFGCQAVSNAMGESLFDTATAATAATAARTAKQARVPVPSWVAHTVQMVRRSRAAAVWPTETALARAWDVRGWTI